MSEISDEQMRAITSVSGVPPIPPRPALSPAAPLAAKPNYKHRELKIISAPLGGWGFIVNGELIGVAETDEKANRVHAAWMAETR